MSNRRFIVFFLAGTAVLGAALWMMETHYGARGTEDRRRTLCELDPAEAEAVEVAGESGRVRLERVQGGGWRVAYPFAAAADTAAVMRLLDAVALTPYGDVRTDAELKELRESLADYGLEPGKTKISVTAGARRAEVTLGKATAGGGEVYARVEGLKNVFTAPRAVAEAVPANVDGYRARNLMATTRDMAAGIEVRTAGEPAVRLERAGGEWRLAAPAPGPAERAVVMGLLANLLEAKIAEFALPAAGNMPPSGTAENGMLPAAALAPYGLTKDAGTTVTVRTESGGAETVTFGAAAGEGLTWALARNGTAVVKVAEEVAARCRVGGETLRDTRVFPVAADEAIEAVTLSDGELVYVLARGKDGKWRLDSPVSAPADQKKALAVVERVVRLKRKDARPDDVPAEYAGGERAVRAAVKTAAASYPAVTVWAKTAPELAGNFADLRSKTMLELAPGTARRLAVKGPGEREEAVTFDAERRAWSIERAGGGGAEAPRRVAEGTVAKKLKLLEKVEARSVRTVAASPETFRECGLDKPGWTVTADAEGPVRLNVLVGKQASADSFWATVGGADAVFEVARETVELLAAPMTE